MVKVMFHYHTFFRWHHYHFQMARWRGVRAVRTLNLERAMDGVMTALPMTPTKAMKGVKGVKDAMGSLNRPDNSRFSKSVILGRFAMPMILVKVMKGVKDAMPP